MSSQKQAKIILGQYNCVSNIYPKRKGGGGGRGGYNFPFSHLNKVKHSNQKINHTEPLYVQY